MAVKVDTLPKRLAASTVYAAADYGIVVTNAASDIILSLYGQYYYRMYGDYSTIQEIQAAMAARNSLVLVANGANGGNAGAGSGTGGTPAPATPTPTPAPSGVNIGEFYAEYHEGYIDVSNIQKEKNTYFSVAFPKSFSKKPDVFEITAETTDKSKKIVIYTSELTNTGFKVSTNYPEALRGILFRAGVFK